MYRLPYVISFGATANRKEYLEMSGRQGIEVPIQWKGLEHARKTLDELRKELLDPYRSKSPFNETFEIAKEMDISKSYN